MFVPRNGTGPDGEGDAPGFKARLCCLPWECHYSLGLGLFLCEMGLLSPAHRRLKALKYFESCQRSARVP